MLKSFRMYDTQDAWDKEVEDGNAALSKNTKGAYDDMGVFGARIIAGRLKDNPYHYKEFGVYWFAVKDVLKRNGYDFGDVDDEEMRLEYQGKTDAHTLLAAEAFKSFYRKTFFQGTTHFTLDQDGNREYVLFDEDMESRR